MKKDFISMLELSPPETIELVFLSQRVKKSPAEFSGILKNMTLAMLFQKTSTRTRVSFEVAMSQLGGHSIYVDWRTANFHLGALSDEISCVSRYADFIVARVDKHEDLKLIAASSRVPVINGLSDAFHPCQALGDLLTIKEKLGSFAGLKIAFVGDGNNVCNSLIIACCKAGMYISVAYPPGYAPSREVISLGKNSGFLHLTHSPTEAVKDAHVVYADTWVSMGQEAESHKRLEAFKNYQITSSLMKSARKDAIFMHCLPAHRGLEVTDEVIDSPQSVVFDQAENRLYVQKALLLELAGMP